MGISRKFALFKVNLNWKWFLNYFDILKEIYKEGFFVLKDQRILAWTLTRKECFEKAAELGLEQGEYSIQGFEDVETPIMIYSPRVIY